MTVTHVPLFVSYNYLYLTFSISLSLFLLFAYLFMPAETMTGGYCFVRQPFLRNPFAEALQQGGLVPVLHCKREVPQLEQHLTRTPPPKKKKKK